MGSNQLLAKGEPILGRVSQALLDQVAIDGGPPIYSMTPERARTVLLRR